MLQNNMHYCHVYGCVNNNQLNFHGWLNDITIKEFQTNGYTIDIQDYKYKLT